ncbi:MAG TPA: hypothetical protein VK154_03430 [Chitinophagales bacterium]|nr:hypothetical protein [Chitinophagales bacterium]
MEISIIALIITAISGPLLTLAVKEYFDYIEKQREREYEIKKLFIQRKMETAENAVKLWESQRRVLQILSGLYEEAIRSPSFGASKHFQELNKQYTDQLNDLTKQAHETTNAVHLYYDIKEEYLEGQSIYQLTGDMHEVNSEIQIISQLQRDEPQHKDGYEKLMDGKIEEVIEIMVKISKALKQSDAYLLECILLLKKEIGLIFPST